MTDYALVVTTYTCAGCCHSWVHPRFGRPTIKGVPFPLTYDHTLNPRDFPAYLSMITHVCEQTELVPICHKCVDLSKYINEVPPQWSRHPSHDNRPTSTPSLRNASRPSPSRVDIKKFLLED